MKEIIYNYDWNIVKKVQALITTDNDSKQIVKRRYLLDVTLHQGNPNNKALFISMNPSKANTEVADATIKKIITYVHKKAETSPVLVGIGTLLFTTLYVVYETNPDKLNDLIDTYGIDYITGNDNKSYIQSDKMIKEHVESADVIFASWGEANIKGYDDRINQIKNMLQDKTVYCIGKPTKKGFPRHLSRIDYSWEIQKYE